MLTRIFLMAISIFGLFGCVSTPITDTASPRYQPPVGSHGACIPVDTVVTRPAGIINYGGK